MHKNEDRTIFKNKRKYLFAGFIFTLLSILNSFTLTLHREKYSILWSSLSLFCTIYATHYFLKKMKLITNRYKLKERFFLLALGFLGLLISNTLLSHFTGNNENQNTLVSYITNESILPLTLFIAQASIIEEMIYRVAWFGIFENKYLAVSFSSILFSLAHSPADSGNFILYFSMGIILAIVRLTSVKTSMALHLIWNLFVLLLILTMKG